MNVREKTNFGFVVVVLTIRASSVFIQRVRMGNHHSVGQKMAVPVQYRTLHDIKIYRQNQYKQQLCILADKFHFLLMKLQM